MLPSFVMPTNIQSEVDIIKEYQQAAVTFVVISSINWLLSAYMENLENNSYTIWRIEKG